MRLFNSSGYYRDDSHSESFLEKAFGVAKIAAIAVAGVKVFGPSVARMVGNKGLAFSATLAERASLRGTAHSFESVAGDILASPYSSTLRFIDQIEKKITSTAAHFGRTEGLLMNLRDHLIAQKSSAANIKAFDKGKSVFINQLTKASKAVTLNDASEILLHGSALREFNKVAKGLGVDLHFTDIAHQRKVFAEAFKTENITQEIIKGFSVKATNRDVIIGAAQKELEQLQKQTKRIYDTVVPGAKHVTIGDIKRDSKIATRVDKYLRKLGVRDATVIEDEVELYLTPVEQLLQRQKATVRRLIPDQLSHASDVTRLTDMLDKALTGFVEHNGQIVSLNHAEKTLRTAAGSFLNELQIPILPGFFPVPAKFFGFIRPAAETVRDYGRLGVQGELKRLGLKLGQYSEGVGFGRNLFEINPETFDLVLHEGISSFSTTASEHIARQARVRGETVSGLFDEVIEQFNESGVKGAAGKWLKGSGARSRINKFATANQETFSSLEYDGENFFRVVNENIPDSISNIINKLGWEGGKSGPLDISNINPSELSNFLRSKKGQSVTGVKLEESIRHISKSAAKNNTDLSGVIKSTLESMIESGAVESIPESYRESLLEIAKNSGSARSYVEALKSSGFMSDSVNTILNREATPGFRRALYDIGARLDRFEGTTTSGPKISERIADAFKGQSAPSTYLQTHQQAILEELLRAQGIHDLGGLQALKDFKTASVGWQDPVVKYFEGKGFSYDDVEKLGATFNLGSAGDRLAESSNFALSALSDESLSKLFGRATNVNQKAKILEILRSHISPTSQTLSEEGVVRTEKVLRNLLKVSDVDEIFRSNQDRILGLNFGATNYLTEDLGFDSRYYLFPSTTPTTEDWIKDPIGTFSKAASKGFGLNEYLRGSVDPNAPVGQFGVYSNLLFGVPQRLGEEIGLGLSNADQVSALRTIVGFYGKRVLPLVFGLEVYRNLNSNLHSVGLAGIDDLAANALANINLNAAKFKDAVGFTDAAKDMVNSIPGLDQYFHPRSEDEYRDYLFYGDEEVRAGRFWLIGSNQNFTGGRIEGMRPNFYRRWRGHWNEAEGMAGGKYSWLPNIENPLGFLANLANPDRWAQDHVDERPYISGGRMDNNKPVDPIGSGTYHLINSVANGTGFDQSYGEAKMGGGFPTITSSYDTGLYAPFGGGLVIGKPSEPGGGGGGSGPGGSGGGPGGGGRGRGSGGSSLAVGSPLQIIDYSQTPADTLAGFNPVRAAQLYFERMSAHSGLYGAVLNVLPLPENTTTIDRQSVSDATGIGRTLYGGKYGEFLGPLGEFYRRFLPNERASFDAFSPYRNNQPSWISNPLLHSGDPKTRVAFGEMNMPGAGYEATHSFVSNLKLRGSAIGLSSEEMLAKLINPIQPMDGDGEDYTGFGTATHKIIQRHLNTYGMLVAAEVPIYDRRHNISGTIDAIVNGANGNSVVEIKTQGGEAFQKRETPDKYIDQINFYLHTTGMETGYLMFVNRDDPRQTRVETIHHDAERAERAFARVETARDQIRRMVERGELSPFETYDLISRIEILARVAPNDPKLREYIKYAETSGGFGGSERKRFEYAKEVANKMRETFNIYPTRYGAETETQNVIVEGVNSDGTVVTNFGVVRLAGIKFDSQAFIYKDVEEVLAEAGLKIGSTRLMTMMKGNFNPEISQDTTLPAIFADVNTNLIKSGFAHPTEDSRNPLDSIVVRGHSNILGGLLERVIHSDTMITNKFLRVRTALEQFRRGEVFGTNKGSWQHPIEDFVLPTIAGVVSHDPVSAAIKGGFIASLFFKSMEAKSKAGYIGATISATLSLARSLHDGLSEDPWVSPAYKKQTEFDEYWDALKFLKYAAIAKGESEKALIDEGVDVAKLTKAQQRTKVNLTPHVLMAIQAERKAKATMYGFDEATGSLQTALDVIPERHRQIAESIITTGSDKDKREFYKLLPVNEKRVLGKFLGVAPADLPKKKPLHDLFVKTFIPDSDWGGWRGDVPLEDLKTRAASLEGTQIERPSRRKLAQAKAATQGIPIPDMHSQTYQTIKTAINNVLNKGGYQNITVNYALKPSNNTQINIDFQTREDHSQQILAELRNQTKS